MASNQLRLIKEGSQEQLHVIICILHILRFVAISPHQHMGLFKHIQTYPKIGVPRVPLKSIWQCWVIPDSLGHSGTSRVVSLSSICIAFHDAVRWYCTCHCCCMNPKWGIQTWWAGWAWRSHPGLDRMWKKKKQLKIGRSFEKRTYSIYFKMIRSTYAGILNLMNGGDAHTQYGSIVNLLTLAHINNQGCWSKYIVR